MRARPSPAKVAERVAAHAEDSRGTEAKDNEDCGALRPRLWTPRSTAP